MRITPTKLKVLVQRIAHFQDSPSDFHFRVRPFGRCTLTTAHVGQIPNVTSWVGHRNSVFDSIWSFPVYYYSCSFDRVYDILQLVFEMRTSVQLLDALVVYFLNL